MFSWLWHNRFLYVLSNLVVIPAIFIPNIELLSNISFAISLFTLYRDNLFLLALVCLAFVLKNNINYRFALMIKLKGEDLSKSDSDCVYLFAWCTLFRYFLILMAVNQIYLYFK